MSRSREERPLLEPGDREFVERLATSYSPPPLSATRRAALDRELRDRIGWLGPRWLLVPALGTAAVAALVWIALSSPLAPAPETGAPTAVASAWEAELFLGSDLSPYATFDDEETLPDDYLAIASAFLGG